MLIRVLDTVDALRGCEDLQREVWGFSELEVVSTSSMVATGHAGGMTAGAFDDEMLVGFVSGFVAHDAEQSPACGLHSHMLAVLPSHRGKGVGKALKWFQRDWCLARGLTWMKWTFDPLQAKNARLNLEHLGATVSTYRLNEYGSLGGELNAGLPTDRLVAFWNLAGERVAALSRGEKLSDLSTERSVTTLDNRKGKPVSNLLTINPDIVRVAVPPDLNKLLQTNLELALEWRFRVREVLIHYFDQGYRATRFQDGFYILKRKIDNS